MDLGASTAAKQPESEPVERGSRRWSENRLVYTRKILRGNKNNTNKNNPPNSLDATPSASVSAPANNPANVISDGKNSDHVANASNPQENDNGKEVVQQKSSSSPAAVPNSLQPQLNSTHLESASEDSSILNQIEPSVPNRHGASVVTGSIVTLVDDGKVKISVSAASSKEGVREIKRKLVDELSQVRKLAKTLEGKEIQISGFRQLSVSVAENNHGIGEVMEKQKRTPKANQYYRNSEFLLGKDRLPPAQSNKKSKASSKKNRSREVDYGFGIDTQLYKKCSNLLQKLMQHKLGWVFNEPVDVKKLGLHDYFDIVKHPMDLGTVKTRLAKNWYKTPREFAVDVRLTFHNAMTYNPEGQDVHAMAKELLRIFDEGWPAIETEYDRKLRCEVIRDLGVPTPTSTKSSTPAHVHAPLPLSPPPLLHHPPSFQKVRKFGRSKSMPVAPESRSMPAHIVGRTPAPKKPKARDPNKREMTTLEKTKLGVNLQSLPAEKRDAVVQIIKKRNTALSQHDDEIEVDIDSVDTETLWELDRFVTNCKKNLSKHKRKAERALPPINAQASQQTIPAPVNTETVKETREGEVNVATFPRDKQEKHSDNASGSSSDSGSSSSDSGSSSSSSSSRSSGQMGDNN